MKKSVCIEAVFEGKDFIEGMETIKSIGYDAFEFWSWWDKDLDAIIAAKNRLGLKTQTFCTKFISLADPALIDNYYAALKESIVAAKKLDCKLLISQVGNDTGKPREEQHAALVSGLKKCAPVLEENDVILVIEPLNIRVDHAGYYLVRSAEAFDIIDEVGSTHVKVLFDIYHQQISEGDILRNVTNNLHKIGHFHAAGNPGRHELTNGELNYESIFEAIDAAGYTGYVGLEYFPLEDPANGLKKVNW